MNVFLIYGNEDFFIEQEINNLKNRFINFKNEIFDLNEVSFEKLIEKISLNSFFSENRIFFIYNLTFFTDKSIKKEDELKIQELINLIFSSENDKFVFINNEIENKTKFSNNFFTKALFENGKKIVLIETNKINESNIFDQVKLLAENLKVNIGNEALHLLIQKLSNNITLINNELIKLSNYKKEITSDFIEISVNDINESNAFSFSNSLESNDFAYIYKKYRKKISEGIDITILISQVSQLLIISNQIFSFKQINKSLDDLSSELNLNIYRIKKVNNFLLKLGINKIRIMIKFLSKLDKDIKEGKVDEKIGFESFLIKFFNK
ncbi:DNA polymerase III subunit delta [Mycoplasmopsis maculosa]|uniref:DNA polymerase III subunit delta n=1 Tax=Mycoplasmopsis maculosa TaxID=114885 RepID=A0A449B3K3_9BACT|nr:DNA polymerase III subunit delta [Mycoplasmopsis maculosa]VEU75167.1 DNA polymerase III subunit delta [Mycoplasmopsis maculosa]